MSSSKCSFTGICGIFLPLNPSTTTVYARSVFYSNLRFTLSLQSACYTQSAVRSPQSAFYTDRELYSLKYTLGKTYQRVWKGIFGIRDLTKIRCGNRENDKYIDGIRDLTVPREPGLAKNWAQDAGFMFVLSVGNGGNRHDPPVLAAKAN